MEEKMIEWVYLTVAGYVSGENALPGVENAFAPGTLCERKYSELYDLLATRFNPDEDSEMTTILNAMDAIQRDLCSRMFRLGMRFALDAMGN